MKETNYKLIVEFKKNDNNLTNIFIKNDEVIVGTAIVRNRGDLAILSKIEIFSNCFFQKKYGIKLLEELNIFCKNLGVKKINVILPIGKDRETLSIKNLLKKNGFMAGGFFESDYELDYEKTI